MKLGSNLIAACTVAALVPSLGYGAQKVRPNVLLITLDTVRADHVGCYGDAQVKTPAIDSLAKDGVLYEHAYSQVPLTWPSHTAIMTGTYPFQNGVQDFTGQPLDPRFQTIAQALKRNGYATGAVVSSFVLDRSWGLARGFDFYDDAFSSKEFETRNPALVERHAGESVDHALNWLKRTTLRSAKPFFLWLHLYDPHSPYDPPQPFAAEYKTHLYDGEIAYADSQIGRIFEWLKKTGRYERTLIVFVSDHGESLGEHGEREHGFFLYSATTHVPLIVKLAGSRSSAERVSAPVESIAIPATVLDFLQVKDPLSNQFQTKALPKKDVVEQLPAYSETFYPFSSFGWSPLHSLQSSRYQYIEAPQAELYDLEADPGELHNLIGERKAIATEMKEALQTRLALKSAGSESAGVNPSQLSPDAVEKLRKLGYMAFKSPVPQSALQNGLSDPKQKVQEFNSILAAADDFEGERFEQGEALLKQVEQSDPEMYLVPFMLGEAALRQQNWTEAKASLERALKLNPNFDQAMTGLARADHELAQDEDARKWLNAALKLNSDNYRAWYELGWLQANLDQGAAEHAFSKAAAIQPNFGPARRDLGLLQYQRKDYAQAAKNLAAAADLGLADPALLNDLGVCYRQMGQLGKSVESYKKALALDPKLPQAHLNLAFVYQVQGRTAAAKKEYDQACQLDSSLCRYAPR